MELGKAAKELGFMLIALLQHNSGQKCKVALFASRLICYFSRVIFGPMLRFASVSPSFSHGYRNAATEIGSFHLSSLELTPAYGLR